MRILGLDYGDRHIGLALSDPLFITAQPLDTIQLEGSDAVRKAVVQALVRKHEIGRIVVGLPLRMDGSEGSRVEKTRAFAVWLERAAGVPVEFFDERLTTHQALRSVQEQKIKIKDRRSVVNQIAAVIILQGYLESRRPDENPVSTD
ncbi:MAG: Holliday junction resolvase RuvX [Candidatus Aminicenantes bacterium]|nr:Holliday junction resolvase RuvX [Candidatus Aminicenantes bacterium]